MSLCFLGLRLKLFISLDLTQLSPHYSVYLTVLNFYHTYIRFLVSWVTLWILEPDPQTLKNAPWKSPEHQSINITHFCFKAPLCYFSVLAKSCSVVPRRLQTMEDQSQPPRHTHGLCWPLPGATRRGRYCSICWLFTRFSNHLNQGHVLISIQWKQHATFLCH